LTDTCELCKLVLMDRDDTTGHYHSAYSSGSIIMKIYPAGSQVNFAGTINYTRHTFTGFTEYNVDEGDVVKNDSNEYFKILSRKEWPASGDLEFYECELQKIPYFSLPTSETLFYGYEDVDHGTIGDGYADGYEHGYYTEVTY
jgi:hypothetical protein